MANSNWMTVELQGEEVALFNAEKQAYKLYKAAKQATEAALRQRLGGDTVYSRSAWGTISVAIGQPKAQEQKQAKPKQNMQEWLEAQRQSGHRV